MSKVLVVDLCGTIVRQNTTHGFLLRAPLGPLKRAYVRALLSRPGFSAARALAGMRHRHLLIRALAGSARELLSDSAKEYAQYALRSDARPLVIARIRSAQMEGRNVLLASASLDVVVESFASLLDASGYVATSLEYVDGIATGRIQRDITGRKLTELRAARLLGDDDVEVITDNPEDTDLTSFASCSTIITSDLQ